MLKYEIDFLKSFVIYPFQTSFSCCVHLQLDQYSLLICNCQVVSRSIRKSPLAWSKKSPVKQHKWTFAEERALVEFVGLSRMDPKYGVDNARGWPAFRSTHVFWTDAARHIQTITCSSVLLTSKWLHDIRVIVQFVFEQQELVIAS